MSLTVRGLSRPLRFRGGATPPPGWSAWAPTRAWTALTPVGPPIPGCAAQGGSCPGGGASPDACPGAWRRLPNPSRHFQNMLAIERVARGLDTPRPQYLCAKRETGARRRVEHLEACRGWAFSAPKSGCAAAESPDSSALMRKSGSVRPTTTSIRQSPPTHSLQWVGGCFAFRSRHSPTSDRGQERSSRN